LFRNDNSGLLVLGTLDLEVRKVKKVLWVVGCCFVLGALQVLAVCPPEDVTGDCIVNFEDLAALSRAWLTGDGIPADMVAIPGGTFMMGDSFNEGDSDERPIHIVNLDSFYMSKYEITNGQYCAFLNATQTKVVSSVVYDRLDTGNNSPYFDTSTNFFSQIAFSNNTFSVRTKGGRNMSNDPVVCVTWYGAVAYCNWRSQQEGKQPCYNFSTWTCDFTKNGYRLPTEAEWEFAARGGLSVQRFPWGNTITHSQANYESDSSYSYDISPTRGFHPTWSRDGIVPYTSPVGSFPANGYGLYDMAGNVWEWCNDWHGGYSSSSQTNPTGPTIGSYRVLRGGGWYYLGAYSCRVSDRNYRNPYGRDYGFGFRVALDYK
jgi:formylglycine-generating enzyme